MGWMFFLARMQELRVLVRCSLEGGGGGLVSQQGWIAQGCFLRGERERTYRLFELASYGDLGRIVCIYFLI